MIHASGKYGEAVIYTDEIEETALKQIILYLNQPMAKGANLRIMPDVHAGAGCVIGFTAKLTDKIVPNLIGVDIGCGVATIVFKKNLPDFKELDDFIRKEIPFGKNVNSTPVEMLNPMLEKVAVLTGQNAAYVEASVCSLGGGNHYIELGQGQDCYTLTVHTGSRNFGLKIANYWQSVAKDKCVDAPKGLEYLKGKDKEGYIKDMVAAMIFAQRNRFLILDKIACYFNIKCTHYIESVHNYISVGEGIIRKGAISATAGEYVLIPFNMQEGMLIAKGRGNADWNYSAPHGAGRKLSRAKAKKLLSIEEFKDGMDKAGVWSSCVNKSTLDEAPAAYKDTKNIMKYCTETITPLFRSFPLYNFKG